jgi:hypothetical protein
MKPGVEQVLAALPPVFLKPNLALRKSVSEAVLSAFAAIPFDWDGASCIDLAHAQARGMGHAVPPVPRFRTAKGALRALRKRGVADVPALLDQWFDRHTAPAFAQIGDLLALPGETEAGLPDHRLVSIGIADGRGNWSGWHGAHPGGVTTVKFAESHFIAAWKL